MFIIAMYRQVRYPLGSRSDCALNSADRHSSFQLPTLFQHFNALPMPKLMATQQCQRTEEQLQYVK